MSASRPAALTCIRMRRYHLVLCAALVQSACGGVAVQPFYLPRQTVFDSTLLGTWAENDSAIEGARISRDGDHYDILYHDDKGRAAHFAGHLFRLAGQLALDVSPAPLPDSVMRRMPDEYWSLLVPGHTLFWVNARGGRLAFAGLDPDTIRTYVRRHPQAVAHYFSDSTLVLTAPTPALRAFVIAYRRRAHVLADSTVWRRTGGH